MLNPVYPSYWATYWQLRTCEGNYTLDQAHQYMTEHDETGEWKHLSREYVRQLETRYMRECHPSSGRM